MPKERDLPNLRPEIPAQDVRGDDRPVDRRPDPSERDQDRPDRPGLPLLGHARRRARRRPPASWPRPSTATKGRPRPPATSANPAGRSTRTARSTSWRSTAPPTAASTTSASSATRSSYKAMHSRYQVIYIDEVHQITRTAFNALLKTLEEPPPQHGLHLRHDRAPQGPGRPSSRAASTSSSSASPRRTRQPPRRTSPTRKSLTITPYGLGLIAEASDGSIRDAQSLLDQAVAFCGETIGDADLEGDPGDDQPRPSVRLLLGRDRRRSRAGSFPWAKSVIEVGLRPPRLSTRS